MELSLQDCIEWVQTNPQDAAQMAWRLLQSLSQQSEPFFDHLEALSNRQLDCESLRAISSGNTTQHRGRSPSNPVRKRLALPSRATSASSTTSSTRCPSRDQSIVSHRTSLVGTETSYPASPTLAPRDVPGASTASSRSPTPLQLSSPHIVGAQPPSSRYLDREVKSFIDKCDLNPSDFISTNAKLSDVGSIGVSALLQNVKKLQRHMKLDRIRLRMHRYVLFVLHQHIKSGLESNYAVKQYLSKVAPDEPFFPGRNDKAFAGKYARWVQEFGGPGILFCTIKIDDRDSPQQGPRREHFIKTHIDAGIVPVVEQLNAVAYKVCNDLWFKTVTWLNKHGDIQWRTTFPEENASQVSQTRCQQYAATSTPLVMRDRSSPRVPETTFRNVRSVSPSLAMLNVDFVYSSPGQPGGHQSVDREARNPHLSGSEADGHNRRGHSLKRGSTVLSPCEPPRVTREYSKASRPDDQDISQFSVPPAIDLLNAPVTLDPLKYQVDQTPPVLQNVASYDFQDISEHSTPPNVSIAPPAQSNSTADLGFFRYDDTLDPFGFNYGTIPSEQDALMALFSDSGWMLDDVVQNSSYRMPSIESRTL